MARTTNPDKTNTGLKVNTAGGFWLPKMGFLFLGLKQYTREFKPEPPPRRSHISLWRVVKMVWVESYSVRAGWDYTRKVAGK